MRNISTQKNGSRSEGLSVKFRTDLELGPDWEGFQGIPSIDVAQLEALCPRLQLSAEVRLTLPVVPLLGHMDASELALLVTLVRHLGARRVAEIGTFDGLTVANLLDNCPELTDITTVDLPQSVTSRKGLGSKHPIDAVNAGMIDTVTIGQRFQHHSRRSIVKQLRKDSASLTRDDFGAAPEVFFIDGSHTYQYCMSDSALAMALTEPEGLIVWHDFGKVKYLPGVTRALLEISCREEWRLYWINEPKLKTSLVIGIRKRDA